MEDIKAFVRNRYGNIAKEKSSCCGPRQSCCSPGPAKTAISKTVGYTEKELASIPEDADLGLGCGNPVAYALLKEGETVLDLGSGAGMDCFLASQKVGSSGRVIGVDMTPEMIDRARENAAAGNYHTVEFRLGEIENLPVADGIVDAVISNCVINLSTDKKRVFGEVFRVLKPGGRMILSDIVLNATLPETVRQSASAYAGCIAGAVLKDEYLMLIRDAGFDRIRILGESNPAAELFENDPLAQSGAGKLTLSGQDIRKTIEAIVSVRVYAEKAF